MTTLVPLVPRDHLSAAFLCLMVLLNVTDAFHLNIVWPMLPFLVRDCGVAERDVGFWVGVCGAASPFGALCTAYGWGKFADAVGRRPALLLGSALSTLSVFVFGTSSSLGQAIFGRFVSGCVNGNAAICKTYLGECTTKASAANAFGVLALGYGLASVAAPGAGGFLLKPAERWDTFKGTIFDTYPYLLPMFVAAALTFTGATLGFFFLPETASFVRRREVKLAGMSREEGCGLVKNVKMASAGELRAMELQDVESWGDVEESGETPADAPEESPKEILFRPETKTAVACYAALAAIAIGYDETLPVYLKTSKELGGCGFSSGNIGLLLIAGGVTLLIFQLTLYKRLCDALGAVNAFRFGVTFFAFISLLAPFASLASTDGVMWAVALVSQCLKICALGIGFVSITIVVNNSCDDVVKARVNGISGTVSAFSRIVAPVICGWIFAASMRLQRVPLHQFVPFVAISLATFALRSLAGNLPTTLDNPKNAMAMDAPSEDADHLIDDDAGTETN
jgi:diphthamide biosynthesis protein 2